MANVTRFGKSSQFVLTVLLFAAFAVPAFAQQSELDALAAKVAAKISKMNKHVVVVPDFTSVDSYWSTPLGSAMAAEFVASLRRAAPSVRFLDSPSIAAGTHWLNVLPQDLLVPDVILALGKEAGAEAGVTAQAFPNPRGVRLKMQLSDLKARVVYRPDDKNLWKRIEEFDAEIQLLTEWIELQKKALDTTNFQTGDRKQGGDSPPECIRCPNRIDPDVRIGGSGGSVTLLLTVNTAGDTQDLLVIRHPGGDLALILLEAVRHWKFKPAHRKDGTPYNARIMVTVAVARY